MRPTIYDIAKKVGVSVATVSKVINNKGRISEKTAEKVRQAMAEMNYYPNAAASVLKGKPSYSIGVILPDIANPFFAQMARRMDDRGQELGYHIVISNTDYNREKEAGYIDLMLKKRVEGILIVSGFEDETPVRQLLGQGVPVVVVAREMPHVEVDTISADNYLGGYMAANYLIKQGHTRVGVIAWDFWSNRERLRGFRDALRERGLEDVCFEGFVPHSLNSLEDGKEMAERILKGRRPVTALFVCNDQMAIGVIEKVRELGLSVPEDLSVMGFDDIPMARICHPPLTTVSQPIDQMAREAVDLLVNQIRGAQEARKRIALLPTLVVRQSVRSL